MTLLFLVAATAQTSIAASEIDPAWRALYEKCRVAVEKGYGSARFQVLCEENFDMAPPYLIKCARWVREGFPSPIDKKSCRLFCASNKSWGPWYDYEIPLEDKETVLYMKRLNQNNRCMVD